MLFLCLHEYFNGTCLVVSLTLTYLAVSLTLTCGITVCPCMICLTGSSLNSELLSSVTAGEGDCCTHWVLVVGFRRH